MQVCKNKKGKRPLIVSLHAALHREDERRKISMKFNCVQIAGALAATQGACASWKMG